MDGWPDVRKQKDRQKECYKGKKKQKKERNEKMDGWMDESRKTE